MNKTHKQDKKAELGNDVKTILIILSVVAIVGTAFYQFFRYVHKKVTGEKILNEKHLIDYLESVLDSYEPNDVYDKILNKGKIIKEALREKFWYAILGNVRYQGSFDQGTFLSEYSDLDILIQFKKTSFNKEEYMYYEVYNFLKNEFRDSNLSDVRKQRVSIGLVYNFNGKREVIDIVPALRTDFNKGGNKYRLYVNPRLSKNNINKIEMNPHIQRDFGNYSFEKIKVVTLLKLLRRKLDLPLEPVLIKEFTKKAFNKLNMPNKLNLQVIKVIEFIQSKILKIKMYAPDNRNNCLTNTISYSEKRKIRDVLEEVLNHLKKDKDSWVEYFPKN